MGFIFILLAMLVLLGGGTYYGYRAGHYNSRQCDAGLFVIFVVLAMSFMLARPE